MDPLVVDRHSRDDIPHSVLPQVVAADLAEPEVDVVDPVGDLELEEGVADKDLVLDDRDGAGLADAADEVVAGVDIGLNAVGRGSD